MCARVNPPYSHRTKHPTPLDLDKISHNDLWRQRLNSSEVLQEKGLSVGTPLRTNVASDSNKVSHENEAACSSGGTSALGLSCRGSGNPLVVLSILKRKNIFIRRTLRQPGSSASQPPTPAVPHEPIFTCFRQGNENILRMTLENILQKRNNPELLSMF